MKNPVRQASANLVGVIASVITLAALPASAGERLKDCTTIDEPGSYTLTRNIKAFGDCIVVAADFVTLDLGGWVITGDGDSGVGVGDDGNVRKGIVVRNGTITEFRDGVNFSLSTSAIVERVRAIDNTDIGIASGNGSIISGNLVRGNGFSGIFARFGSVVSGNTAISNFVGISAPCPSSVYGNASSANTTNLLLGGIASECSVSHNVPSSP